MKETFLNTTVKKILKNKNKIITTTKIKKIVQDIMDDNYNNNKAYKLIYYMKNRWYLISLKKDLFFVKTPNQNINEVELIETVYRDLLKQHCKQNLNNDRYISGIKALEINMSNFSVPEEIAISNPYKQSRETVIKWKIINFKKVSSSKSDIFKHFKKYTQKQKLGKYIFYYSNLELAMLESLYSPDILVENYNKELVKKAIKKYKKVINYTCLQEIIRKWKHHTSINRLYKVALSLDNKIAENIADIIRKESFFL